MKGTVRPLRTFGDLEAWLDRLEGPDAVEPRRILDELLEIAEDAVSHWIVARGDVPTDDTKEGFRLLALHRQGAKGDPSFNACRESCRELAYGFNLISGTATRPDAERRARLAIPVARHIVLFVSGKLEVAGLGEFCCSSKPLRAIAP